MGLPGMKRIRCAALWRLSGIVAASVMGAASGQSIAAAGTQLMAPPPANTSVHIHRQIRDPHSGAHWLVVSNPANPGGPGRVILENDASTAAGNADAKRVPVVAIHPGDKVLVEEHTATVEACLEAIAVDAAAIGSPIKARLKIGGKVVRAVAIAPGRAALVHPGEAQP